MNYSIETFQQHLNNSWACKQSDPGSQLNTACLAPSSFITIICISVGWMDSQITELHPSILHQELINTQQFFYFNPYYKLVLSLKTHSDHRLIYFQNIKKSQFQTKSKCRFLGQTSCRAAEVRLKFISKLCEGPLVCWWSSLFTLLSAGLQSLTV